MFPLEVADALSGLTDERWVVVETFLAVALFVGGYLITDRW